MLKQFKGLALGGLLLMSAMLVNAQTPTPPFNQCPKVGANTSCAILIWIQPSGTVTVLKDPAMGPYDGVEDTLVGVLNQSATAISTLPLTSTTDIFGFDGDGPCQGYITCTYAAPTGYEGGPYSPGFTNSPLTSFTNINSAGNSGNVNFSPAIPTGGTAWFALEENLNATQIVVGPPGAGGVVVNTPAFLCTANAGVPPTVRAEGLTELVGDLVLNCTGGKPTENGKPIPQANITVFLSTNITSRITSSPFVESLLIIDEPHSASNPLVPLSPCDPGGATLGICSITGNATGIGIYDGSAGRPNVFQGRLTGVNQVTFFGVPIDPAGTANTRIIRITNVRGNANQLGVSSTLVPTQITMYVSITGSTSIPVNNPSQTVAFVQRGLTVSVRSGTLTAPNTFIQCLDANGSIAKDPTAALGAGGQNGQQFALRFDEGFGSAWKPKNIQHYMSNTALGINAYTYPNDSAQDIPGAIYNSETGFLVNGVRPSPYPANIPNLAVNAAFPSTRGLNVAGLANQGTRLMATFNAIPNGTQLFVPTRVNLINQQSTSSTTGFAVLTSTDANGAGAFSAASGNSAGLAPVSVFNGTATVVYEIIFSDPFNLERLQVPIAVAFVSNAGNNLPAPGVQSTITGGFAPVSNVGTASDTAPIPRFAPSGTPLNDFTIVKCSCNILFPFVTNQQGYDTGVAISNTSVDPFGTTPQAGTVTLNYYSGGTPPPAQTTNAPVPGGQTLAFTLSGGGNFGIASTPGFQGYLIAQAQFQYCHAFAYISAQGALPTAAGASEGYLGIILDAGGLNRTGQVGEVQAH